MILKGGYPSVYQNDPVYLPMVKYDTINFNHLASSCFLRVSVVLPWFHCSTVRMELQFQIKIYDSIFCSIFGGEKMQYLFTDSYGTSVLISAEEKTIRLFTADESMQITSQSVEVKHATANVLQALCDAYVQQQKMTSEQLEEKIKIAHSTAARCRDAINQVFMELGFQDKCINGFQLAQGVTCTKLVTVSGADVPSGLLEQTILFQDAPKQKKRISTLSQAKYRYLPQKSTGYSCLLLYGTGGLGKTTFLKSLLDAWPDAMGDAFYCSLTALLEEAAASPILKQAHCGTQISRAGCTGKVHSSYLFRHCGLMQYEGSRTYTFLLDGLNELIDRSNSRTYDSIRQILDEIAMLNVPNVYVILTTRNPNDADILNKIWQIRTATLSGLRETTDIADSIRSDEAMRLLSLPLFYTMYQKLRKQKKAIPDSRYGLWYMFHRNACEQAYRNKNLPADEVLYRYYILLPMFAHFMEVNRTDYITKTQAIRLISKVQNSVGMQEICQSIINQIEGGRLRTQIQFLNTAQIIYRSFRNIAYFISFQEDRISFLHQEIREYFAAFHVVWFIKSIRFAPLSKTFLPNFNLRSDVQKLALEALGFLSQPPGSKNNAKPENQPIRQKNGERLLELFGTSEVIRASFDMEEIRSQIEQNLCLCHCAYSFTDHFMLQLPETRYTIMSPFCESLLHAKRFVSEYIRLFPTEDRQMMIDVYTGMIYYYRVHHHYGKCREIYDFCMEYLSEGCAPFYIRKLRHQLGKVLLYNSQDLLTGVVPESEYNPEHGYSAEDMFAKSLEVLESCLPYNMTANILGHLYAFPVKWITEHGLLKRDVCKAFLIYRDAYRDMTDPDYLLVRQGTELVYTARQMLGLLTKGYVHLRNQEPMEGDKCPLFAGDESRESMDFAAEVLTHLTGQSYPFLDWNRGVVNLYQNHTEAAMQNFENEKDNCMTQIIALAQHWEKDGDALREKLRDTLREIKKTAGETVICEHTDTAYYLLDAEKLLQDAGLPVPEY